MKTGQLPQFFGRDVRLCTCLSIFETENVKLLHINTDGLLTGMIFTFSSLSLLLKHERKKHFSVKATQAHNRDVDQPGNI